MRNEKLTHLTTTLLCYDIMLVVLYSKCRRVGTLYIREGGERGKRKREGGRIGEERGKGEERRKREFKKKKKIKFGVSFH